MIFLSKDDIVNTVLRFIPLFSKFLFVFFLGKYLSIEVLGEYSLFYTYLTLVVYAIGLEVYTVISRKVILANQIQRESLISRQFSLYVILYLFCFFVIVFFSILKLIEYKFAFFFFIILIFEHSSQEFYRVFINFEMLKIANILYFLRNGVWPIIVILSWILFPTRFRSLYFVYSIWSFFAFLSLFASIFFLKKKQVVSKFIYKLNIKWIKKVIYLSLPFFVLAILSRLNDSYIRTFVSKFYTNELVGVYSLFYSLCNVMTIFVQTIIAFKYYPKLIEKRSSCINDMLLVKRIFFKESLFWSVGFMIFLIVMLYPMLLFMKKIEICHYFDLYLLMLLSTVLNNISFVSYYSLYALKRDLDILKINICYFLFIISMSLAFNSMFYYATVYIVLLIANLLLFIIQEFRFKIIIDKSRD